MENTWYLVRFFHAVAPVPRLTILGFVVLTAAASVKIAINPHDTAGALLPIVVLQVFASSSGFAGPARRGYYDLVLTRADGRLRIAIVQWLASVTPGVLAWLAIVLVEMAVTFGQGTDARSSGTIVTVFLVSTLPWAITVPLPRFAGAIGWLLLLVTATSFSSAGPGVPLALSATTSIGGLPQGVGVLLFPPALIGRDLGGSFVPVAFALALATLAMASAVAWIHRADFALEAAQ